MTFWHQVRGWFRREAADAKDALDDLEGRLDRDLSERERRLEETPAEAMERLQREIADESAFDEIRDKIGGREAHAQARADLAEAAGEVVTEDDGSERDPDDLDRSGAGAPSAESDPSDPTG